MCCYFSLNARTWHFIMIGASSRTATVFQAEMLCLCIQTLVFTLLSMVLICQVKSHADSRFPFVSAVKAFRKNLNA